MIADKINTEGLVGTLQVQDVEGDSDFSRPAICGAGRGRLPVPFPGDLAGTAARDGITLGPSGVHGITGDLAVIVVGIELHGYVVIPIQVGVAAGLQGW